MPENDTFPPEDDILTDSLIAQRKILTQRDLDDMFKRIKTIVLSMIL